MSFPSFSTKCMVIPLQECGLAVGLLGLLTFFTDVRWTFAVLPQCLCAREPPFHPGAESQSNLVKDI